MHSKLSDGRFISHGISPSGIVSNDRFGARLETACGLRTSQVRGAFIKQTPCLPWRLRVAIQIAGLSLG
jgi:hypothetical protein